MSTPAGVRRLLLDEAPGERRGVVLCDGLPERLLIEREGDAPAAALGARLVGRLRAAAGGRAFVDLPDGPPGLVRLPSAPPPEGAALELEVAAEAQGGKGPRLRLLGLAEGAPRLLAGAPALADRLRAFAPGTTVERGEAAREAADLAQEAALAVSHRFRGGLTLHVEPTRALAAVDVDLEAGEGAGGRRLREANLSAIRHAVRLLRLKALGGVAVLDLLGFPEPEQRGLLRAEAARALAPDGGEAVAAAPDRFGLLHLSRPRRERPLADVLCDPDRRVSARTTAQRLLRDLEREGRADPGAVFQVVAPPDVVGRLAALPPPPRPRFTLQEEVAVAREAAHIRRA